MERGGGMLGWGGPRIQEAEDVAEHEEGEGGEGRDVCGIGLLDAPAPHRPSCQVPAFVITLASFISSLRGVCSWVNVDLVKVFGLPPIHSKPSRRNLVQAGGSIEVSPMAELERGFGLLASAQRGLSPLTRQVLGTMAKHTLRLAPSSPAHTAFLSLLFFLRPLPVKQTTELLGYIIVSLNLSPIHAVPNCLFCSHRSEADGHFDSLFSASPILANILHAFLIHFPIVEALTADFLKAESMRSGQRADQSWISLLQIKARDRVGQLVLGARRIPPFSHTFDGLRLAVGLGEGWGESKAYAFASALTLPPTLPGPAQLGMAPTWSTPPPQLSLPVQLPQPNFPALQAGFSGGGVRGSGGKAEEDNAAWAELCEAIDEDIARGNVFPPCGGGAELAKDPAERDEASEAVRNLKDSLQEGAPEVPSLPYFPLPQTEPISPANGAPPLQRDTDTPPMLRPNVSPTSRLLSPQSAATWPNFV